MEARQIDRQCDGAGNRSAGDDRDHRTTRATGRGESDKRKRQEPEEEQCVQMLAPRAHSLDVHREDSDASQRREVRGYEQRGACRGRCSQHQAKDQRQLAQQPSGRPRTMGPKLDPGHPTRAREMPAQPGHEPSSEREMPTEQHGAAP